MSRYQSPEPEEHKETSKTFIMETEKFRIKTKTFSRLSNWLIVAALQFLLPAAVHHHHMIVSLPRAARFRFISFLFTADYRTSWRRSRCFCWGSDSVGRVYSACSSLPIPHTLNSAAWDHPFWFRVSLTEQIFLIFPLSVPLSVYLVPRLPTGT